jgi:hypothetical protein
MSPVLVVGALLRNGGRAWLGSVVPRLDGEGEFGEGGRVRGWFSPRTLSLGTGSDVQRSPGFLV